MTRALYALAVVLAFATTAYAQGISPGPLARDHAALEGLDNCVRCHSGGGDAVTPASCLSCHKALGQRIAARQGYHAQLGTDCAKCHPDHRGVNAELVKWPGGQRDRFDHDKTGYKLASGHAKVACRDCHKPQFLQGAVASALTTEEKPRTYLGLSTTCQSCHADPHKPSLGSDCAKCHDATTWRGASTATGFDHGKTRYPLLGAHAKVECTKCHGGTAQKLQNLHPAFDTCKTCHQDPHAGAMGTDASACASCHGETSWKELHYDRKRHAPKTLPLVDAHAKPACAACHGAKNDQKPVPTCTPCHADPHRPSLGGKCETCHGTAAWTKTTAALTKSTAFHDRTAYPLRGAHTTVACAACHDPKKPASKRFRPLAHGKCLDCHADPHQGEASKPCEGCHVVAAWKPSSFEAADHAKTRFQLDGAHRAVPCAKCHPAAPKSSGFKQGNPACETCHADPHAGQFAGKGTCATCHGTTAWAPSLFTKEAHAKAGLALAGKHDVACGRCHRKQFVGLSNDCGACHDDRHANQLAPKKCSECHAGAQWKPTPGFDHAKTFALVGRHAQAACASCHPKIKVQVRPGTAIESEVYRLGDRARECVGCHRAPHGRAGSALAVATRACASCHGETTWWTLARAPFDHAVTGAPLVGGHARTPCASCHQATRGDLPKLAACATCHQDRHAGRLGDRCESCHSPMTWKPDRVLVDHQRTRLPLVGAHAVQACAACHTDAQAGTFRGLDPACRGCHWKTVEDIHPHPDHTKDLAFNACENCHSVLGWRPAYFDHRKYWVYYTGKHPSVPCTQCHAPGQPFGTAPSACLGCHMADQAKANADPNIFVHDSFGPECQTCHNTTSWLGATFDHKWFRLPHRGATCAQCHTTPGMPKLFSCTSGGCHPKSQTDGHHGDVGGYSYTPTSCTAPGCHQRGGGGD